MPVRVSKPVSKYLDAQIRQRIGLLESALIELHDIDNRMKMELLALNSMLDVDDDEFSIDTINPGAIENDADSLSTSKHCVPHKIASPVDELRYRRALNTTPDSSVSYSSSCDSIVESYNHSDPCFDDLKQCHLEHEFHKIKSSTTPFRHLDYTYVRDEDEVEDLDENLPVQSSIFTTQSIRDRFELFKYNRIIIIFCVLLSVLLLTKFSPSVFSPNGSSTLILEMKTFPYTLTKQLAKEYPQQQKRLWAQIRSALEPQSLYMFDQLDSSPVIILLVNRFISLKNISTTRIDVDSSDSIAHSHFNCFISRINQLIGKQYPYHSQPYECPVLGQVQDKLIPEHDKQFKIDLDNQLIDFYKKGFRCFHFTSIDLLPPDVVLLFHGVADSENSLYRNSIFVLSISNLFKASISADCNLDSLHKCLSSSQFEHQIAAFLRSLWTKYLGNEEVDALLSRLTTNIAVFHTFLNITSINENFQSNCKIT